MSNSGMESLIDNSRSGADDASVEGGQGRSLRQAAYLTVGLGFAHALLYILSYYLLQQTPGGNASDAEILEFYSSGGDRRLILVGLYVMPFAGIAFVWFTVALRMWISVSTKHALKALYSNVQLVSGIIFVGLLFTAGAASAATAASMEFSTGQVDPMMARQLPQLSSTILIVFAMRMAAMFPTTSSIGPLCRHTAPLVRDGRIRCGSVSTPKRKSQQSAGTRLPAVGVGPCRYSHRTRQVNSGRCNDWRWENRRRIVAGIVGRWSMVQRPRNQIV